MRTRTRLQKKKKNLEHAVGRQRASPFDSCKFKKLNMSRTNSFKRYINILGHTSTFFQIN